MSISLKLPENLVLKPTITVFGIGGAGGNAVNNMIKAKLQGANFVAANTDAQALDHSLAPNKIQLGLSTTKGLGAGASPEVGRNAALESEAEIRELLNGSNMVFITAGMGGGTGTGAAPVVARIARDLGILTVGVVTKPFNFEGKYRMKLAESGLSEIQQNVDTLIIIPNQNLFHIANEKTTFADAFQMADDVLHAGVRGVTDLMVMPGLINLDFADIRSVMSEMGKAMMGTGEASGGEDRAIRAAEAAISNPLLDHRSVRGARGVLINITGGMDMTLFEVDAAANRIREEVGDDSEANIIFGSTFNKELDGIIRVSVVATGIDAEHTHYSTKTYSPSIMEQAQEKPIIAEAIIQEKITEKNAESTFQENEKVENTEDKFAVEKSQTSMTIEVQEEAKIIAPIVPEKTTHAPIKPKTSIFGKMINSMRLQTNYSSVQNNQEDRFQPKGDKVEPISETADIYDVPAFLRRK